MKKYIDLLGVGAMMAIITIATLDLYVYDQQPKFEPIAYPSQQTCSDKNSIINKAYCHENDEFLIYENSRSQTIDISVQRMR